MQFEMTKPKLIYTDTDYLTKHKIHKISENETHDGFIDESDINMRLVKMTKVFR